MNFENTIIVGAVRVGVYFCITANRPLSAKDLGKVSRLVDVHRQILSEQDGGFTPGEIEYTSWFPSADVESRALPHTDDSLRR